MLTFKNPLIKFSRRATVGDGFFILFTKVIGINTFIIMISIIKFHSPHFTSALQSDEILPLPRSRSRIDAIL